MRTYFLNPHIADDAKYIREGRCMQKASSWVMAWPPMTLATLAAIAKKKGLVYLMDGNVENMTLSQLINNISKFDPDTVVVNAGFPSIDKDMAVAGEIKRAFPSVKVLSFGVYFTLLEKEGIDKYPFLDFCIIGEPEETFEEFVDVFGSDTQAFSKINGLAYRDKDRVIMNPKRNFIENLDKLPFPERDLLKNNLYRLPHNNRPYALINTARGCPHQCIYCVVNAYYGSKIRKHSIDYVIAEIKQCVDKYGIKEFLFWEEVFTLDRNYALGLCRAITGNNLSIHWAATTRVDLVDEELLKEMKKAGCYLLGLGIESFDQNILITSKKRITIEHIKKAVAACRAAKIKTMGHFILGLPGETAKTGNATIRFMLKLGLDYMQCYSAVPYPKTEFGEMAKISGWLRTENWSEYDFGGDSIVNLPTISCEELTNLRKKAFLSFYLRPGYILKTIFSGMPISQMIKLCSFIDWINLMPKGKKI